jgi:hypothetical protein
MLSDLKMHRQSHGRAVPIGLIHGCAIGASYARLARRWIGALHRSNPWI